MVITKLMQDKERWNDKMVENALKKVINTI